MPLRKKRKQPFRKTNQRKRSKGFHSAFRDEILSILRRQIAKKTSETRERTVSSLTGRLSNQQDGENLNRATKKLTGRRFSLTGRLSKQQDGENFNRANGGGAIGRKNATNNFDL